MGSPVTVYTERKTINESVGNGPAPESVVDGPLGKVETNTDPVIAKGELVTPVRRPKDQEARQKPYLVEKIRAERFDAIVGESPALETALHLVSIVAPTDSSV